VTACVYNEPSATHIAVFRSTFWKNTILWDLRCLQQCCRQIRSQAMYSSVIVCVCVCGSLCF